MGRRSPVTIPHADPRTCTHGVRQRALAAVPFFASLDPDALAEVDARCGMRGIVAGEAVYLAGGRAERLYVVATGTAKLTRTTEDGDQILLDVLGPGGFLGALPALGEDRYAENAWALTPGCLLSLTTADLDAVLQGHPGVARDALTAIGRRLRRAEDTLARAGSATVEQRIAATLLLLADRLGTPYDGATLIDAPLTRDDIAGLVGCASETVSRILARLRRRGLVRTGRRWVAVADPARLREVAEHGIGSDAPGDRSRQRPSTPGPGRRSAARPGRHPVARWSAPIG